MDDEIKHNDNEEEFQFTEIEEPELFEPVKEPSTWYQYYLEALNRRNLIIAVGIIIVALAMYKLWGVFTSRKPTPPQPVPIRSAVLVPPTTLTTQSADLLRIQEQMSAEKEKVNGLEININTLTNNMTGMQQSLDSIKTQLNDLMSMFKTQQAEIQALKPKAKLKQGAVDFCGPIIVKRKIERLRYYVKAIVPGRAWLVAPNGLTVTVAEGDRLPGYGKIVSISAVHSTVTTSSGTIIRYRVNVSSSKSPYI
jgi:intracellular multiplication protein IcmG